MTDITIPREALVKAAKVLHDHAEIFVDVPWEDLSDGDQEAYIEEARAACLALIENWPGMRKTGFVDPKGVATEWFILPLPKENSDEF